MVVVLDLAGAELDVVQVRRRSRSAWLASGPAQPIQCVSSVATAASAEASPPGLRPNVPSGRCSTGRRLATITTPEARHELDDRR